MLPVLRCSLSDKRRSTAFGDDVFFLPTICTLYSGPNAYRLGPWHNITSFNQSKYQRSICLSLLSVQLPGSGISLIQSLTNVFGQMNIKGRRGGKKEGKEGGTLSSFGSRHPQFKGQMSENST